MVAVKRELQSLAETPLSQHDINIPSPKKRRIPAKLKKIQKHDSIKVKNEVDSDDEFKVKTEPIDDFQLPLPDSDNDNIKISQLHKLNFILNNLKLTNELPNYTFTRKPKIKFKPEKNSVLNLSNINLDKSLIEQIDLNYLYFLHYLLIYSKKLVIITGAGISVNSGIPDFRSSNGLFQGLSKKNSNLNGSGKNLFDYNVFRDSNSIEKFEKMIEKLFILSNSSLPSPFHHLINQISAKNRLLRLYTQNIDCLDIQLPHLDTQIPLKFNSLPKTIQLHGNIKLLNCSKCNYITNLNDQYFQNRKFGESKIIRTCPSCEEMNVVREIAGKRLQNVGILRPRIVLYNEFHPDGEIIGSITEKDLKNKPDCLIITGTTLKIPGVRRLVKEMSRVVHSNKGYVIWINIDEPSQSIIDYVDYFDLIIIGDCQLIPGLVKLYDHLFINEHLKSKKITKKQNNSVKNKENRIPKTKKIKKE